MNIQKLISSNEVFDKYIDHTFKNVSGNFLDLSCGTRNDIRKIVEFNNYKYYGIDLIEFSNVIKADAHYLPFRSNVFDIVYAAAAFEHYKNPTLVINEVRRVLKPNGIFLGLVAFLQPEHGNSYFHFTHLGICELLVSNGFECVNIDSGNINGIEYLIQTSLPKYISIIGKILGLIFRFIFFIRTISINLFLRLSNFYNRSSSIDRINYFKRDKLRYSASIIFFSKKISR